MKEEPSASLCIELNVNCPICYEYIDLLSHDMGLNGEGEIISQACPQDGNWIDSHQKFEQEVECPSCDHVFLVSGIDW